MKYYVLKHNEFAKAMRKVDPSITLIASGQMLEDMNLTGDMRVKYMGNLEAAVRNRRGLDWRPACA